MSFFEFIRLTSLLRAQWDPSGLLFQVGIWKESREKNIEYNYYT